MANVNGFCEGERSAAEGQTSSGPDQKVPLEFLPSFLPQLLEATYPNPAAMRHPTGHLKRVARLPKCSLWLPVQEQEGSRLPNAVPSSPLDLNWMDDAETQNGARAAPMQSPCAAACRAVLAKHADPGARGDGC